MSSSMLVTCLLVGLPVALVVTCSPSGSMPPRTCWTRVCRAADAARELASRFGCSPRQAHRYVHRRATEHHRQSVGGVRPAVWTGANDLSFMDDAGIDVAVASISAPGVHLGDDQAQMVSSRPDRFGGFAILPLPDIDAALAELTRALDELFLDGIVLPTNAAGNYLGEPLYRPLFDELQRRARPSCSSTRQPRRVRPRPAWGCPIHCSTSRPTPRVPWPRCTTAVRSPAPPTSNTCCHTLGEPCHTWPTGSPSSTKWA